MICAECEHWASGEFWGTNNRKNSTLVACKGWCTAKPNKRKRWNYQSAYKCKLFQPREKDGIILSGTGPITNEQLAIIVNFLKRKIRLRLKYGQDTF